MRTYARAAAGRTGMDRFQEQHWVELEQRAGATPPPKPTASISAPQPQQPRRFRM